jgi:ABC-type sugar transport system ATPase subunit
MTGVEFSRVWKRFGAIEAVRELTLAAADGEFLVLVGPSGSGKTTALRMLAGLESVSEGEIRIGEAVVNRVAPRERDIAMVFQDYALYPQMTVYGNLAFGLRRRGIPKRQIDEQVRRAAAALELDALLERRPRELSGGQQQRVALGRALVRDPQVFLMDEPLSNLDAQLRVQTRGEIKRLQQEIGTTTVYVTHDQVEAMTMGDRIAVMNDGRLEQAGTPAELYDAPANVFVAGFIGSPAMTFARVRAERDGDAMRLRRDGVDLLVPCGPRVPEDGGPVTVGVRPEHARPWADGADLLGPLEGTVEYVEALGRETFLGVRQDAETRLVVCVDGRSPARPGDRVAYGLVSEGLHFFDAETGHALQPAGTPSR